MSLSSSCHTPQLLGSSHTILSVSPNTLSFDIASETPHMISIPTAQNSPTSSHGGSISSFGDQFKRHLPRKAFPNVQRRSPPPHPHFYFRILFLSSTPCNITCNNWGDYLIDVFPTKLSILLKQGPYCLYHCIPDTWYSAWCVMNVP